MIMQYVHQSGSNDVKNLYLSVQLTTSNLARGLLFGPKQHTYTLKLLCDFDTKEEHCDEANSYLLCNGILNSVPGSYTGLIMTSGLTPHSLIEWRNALMGLL
jgi:hypothetical protein